MPARASDLRPLAVVAAVSGIYDITLGFALLFGRELLQSLFALPAPAPPIHADLNAIFLLAVGVGYAMPYRRPDLHRGYLWVMGPFLKGIGALAFVIDHVVRQSPPAFLLLAVTDGSLAIITLWVLWVTRARRA
ncbi:MAG TPA: hypothetical protein VF332_12835 [Vicinamibacterales bacterium]|jgi:hypothetical protein